MTEVLGAPHRRSTSARRTRSSSSPTVRSRTLQVAVWHVPIVDETRQSETVDSRPDWSDGEVIPLDEIYLLMLDRFGHRFVAVLDLIAERDSQPVVFHCAAGKDRTGLVAMLDPRFARCRSRTSSRPTTHSRTSGCRSCWSATWPGSTATVGVAEVAQQRWAIDAAAMRTVDRPPGRREHGSIEGYVVAQGLGPDGDRAPAGVVARVVTAGRELSWRRRGSIGAGAASPRRASRSRNRCCRCSAAARTSSSIGTRSSFDIVAFAVLVVDRPDARFCGSLELVTGLVNRRAREVAARRDRRRARCAVRAPAAQVDVLARGCGGRGRRARIRRRVRRCSTCGCGSPGCGWSTRRSRRCSSSSSSS